MEKPLNEDFNGGWKIMRAMMWGIIGMMFIAGLMVHDFTIWLLGAVTALFFVVYTRYQRNRVARRSTPSKTWLLTDAGLQRVYTDPPARETIPWNSIERMRWVRYLGLLFFWNESGQRCEAFRNEFEESDFAGLYRGVLNIDEKEADEVAELWLKHQSPKLPDPPTDRSRRDRRPLSRQAKQALLLTLGLGLVLIGWGAVSILRHASSSRWPSVQGKIISQDYWTVAARDNSRDRAKLHLTYRYKVGAQEHYGSQYGLGQSNCFGIQEDVRAIANRYPTGAVVQVYYNPDNPGEAVLHAGPDWREDSDFPLLGAFFVFLALFLRKVIRAQAVKNQKTEKNWLVKVYGTQPK